MKKIVILINFILLYSSVVCLAQNSEQGSYNNINNQEIISVPLDSLDNLDTAENDNIKSKMAEVKEQSNRVYNDLVKALNNPVDEEHNNILINEYVELNNLYPHDNNYKSDYVSDDFIFGYYYELPLLKKYRVYTDELTSVISTIQEFLLSPDTQKLPNLKRFRDVTNDLLQKLKKTGRCKMKNNKTLSFQYGSYYNKRDKEASIQYLNDQIDSLQSIINNENLDTSEMNLQLTLLQQKLLPKNSKSNRDSYFAEIEKQKHQAKKNNQSTQPEIPSNSTDSSEAPVAPEASVSDNSPVPPVNTGTNPPDSTNPSSNSDTTSSNTSQVGGQNPTDIVPDALSEDDGKGPEYKPQNKDNLAAPIKKPGRNQRLDKNLTRKAVNDIKKNLDALMRSVDSQVIKDTNEFEKKIDEMVEELKQNIKQPIE